jgi:cytochrome c553
VIERLLPLLLAALAPAAGAADVAAGREKAQACAVCHGQNGLSVAPDAPHLAGQPAIYLAAQLRAYRSGKRAHEVMAVMAKPLSDADIDNLAAWYASIAIEVKKAP